MGDKKQLDFSVRDRLKSNQGESKQKEKQQSRLVGLEKLNMQFFAGNGSDGDKRLTRLQKIILIGLIIVAIGIILTFMQPQLKTKNNMSMITPVVEASSSNKSSTKEDKSGYDTELENRLEEILQEIEGVGKVKVMVTLATSKEKVLAEEKNINNEKTEEKDSTGGTRATNKENTQNKVIMAEGNVPYIVREEMPVISGVLIVAEGAGDSIIESNIRESVQALLNLAANKVVVRPMEKN